MKDNMKACQHGVEDVVYKEVVVIGNGPSGLVTSFMLAGNVPHLKPVPDDLPIDDMLRARLSNLPEGQSLYETDLIALAQGLEGRSQNPIPLLMDNLLRPCADMGIQADPLIEWKYDVEKQIDHIVLGRGPPGGSWHSFPRSVRTLSPGGWLSLPPHAPLGDARLSARAVAMYLRRYVLSCNLQRYFRNNVVVNSVTLAPPSAERCPAKDCPLSAKYIVSGYDKSLGRGFRYLCARVVTACGAADRPNAPPHAHTRAHAHHRLDTFERAVHDLTANDTPPQAPVLVMGSGVSACDAVWACLRRGAAVVHIHRAPPAALAPLTSRTHQDYAQVYKMMCDGPSGNHKNYTPYPYHVIVDITPLTHPHQTDHTPSLKVKLLDLHTNEAKEIIVSAIGVFIGSKPDLFFLQTNFNLNRIELKSCACVRASTIENRLKTHWIYLKAALRSIQNCKPRYFLGDKCHDCTCDVIPYSQVIENKMKCHCEDAEASDPLADGLGFGVDGSKPVDSRNPVAIDRSSHELLNAPKGLYALGPLTADNFVRFIPGGALAIVSHVHRDR